MTGTLVQPKIATIEPKGHVSAANARELQYQITTVVTTSTPSVLLVNMQEVEFMDSAGLMVLVNAFNQAKDLGLRFTLCSLNESVRMILELTQLDEVFEIVESHHAFELA